MARREHDSPKIALPSDRKLVLTRTFDAPRALVWKAWTKPEQLMRWWGPEGFTSPVCQVDLRVGGAYLFCMRSPEGKDYWSTGVYREIVEPERLVCTDCFADEKGNAVPASHYGMAGDWPAELLVIVTLQERQGMTTLTLEHFGLPEGEMSRLTAAGWNGSFDKMARALERTTRFQARGDRELVMTRIFDAPRERVFQAYTNPRLIPQWWGPARYTTTVDKMEVRPGGAWRYIHRGADGSEYGFKGVYGEVVPPERLVTTFEFEGMPGHVSVDTAVFEDLGGKTRLTATSVFQNAEDRGGMLSSGAEEGAIETWERLAKLLA
jgi:uncharacterized protein YndB with AHSA1/START domain